MLADAKIEAVRDVRGQLASWLSPLTAVAASPTRWLQDSSEQIAETVELKTQLAALEKEVDRLNARQQRMRALEAENKDLRQLLRATERFDDEFVHAEVLAHSPDPFIKRLTVNRGFNAKAAPGQAVVDTQGLVGQVVEVGSLSSQVLLLTDPAHQVPVEVARSGFKAIARGLGNSEQLELLNVPPTAEIKVGDLLQTSGLGQRFPAGYPVARVVEVVREPGKAFAKITASPIARTARLSRVMLVYRTQTARDRALAALEVIPSTR